MKESIARYNENLERGELASASNDDLTRLLRQEGLFFGDRPLCSVLRPRFLSTAQYLELSSASARIGAIFEKLRVAAMGDAGLREQFHLSAWEETIIHADPGYPVASPTSRLDAFYADAELAALGHEDGEGATPEGGGGAGGGGGRGGLKFTEFNAETPAGGAYNDVLSRVFMALPAMYEFSKSHVALPIPAAPSIVHAILEAFYSWRGSRVRPTVCILDWAEVPTRSEFVLYQKEFALLGIDAFIGDPREAEFSGGKFTVGGKTADLIYKRVLIDELIEREGVESPVVKAVSAGAVCMVNSFRCKLLHKKASLAVASDERNDAYLTTEERAAVERFVPWTRTVEQRKTRHRGRSVDLMEFAASNRERLVLKPNDDYGGKGIVLGWTVSDSEWQTSLGTALAQPYIVQERVAVPSEEWPAILDGKLHVGERMLDTAPFLADGTVMTGCLTRIATDPLLNVTAGGGSNVPTFLVEPR